MFRELPVFQLEAFATCRATMKRPLDTEKSPLHANSEAAMPGMSQWQSVNHTTAQGVRAPVENLAGAVAQGFRDAAKDTKRE